MSRVSAALMLLLSLTAGGCASYHDAVESRAREEAAAQPPAQSDDPRSRFMALADRCAGGDPEALAETAALYQGTLDDRTLAYQDHVGVQAFERCAEAVRRRREEEEGHWRAACMARAGGSGQAAAQPDGAQPQADAAAGPPAQTLTAEQCETEARRRRQAMQSELSGLMRLVVRDEMRCALFARHFYVRGDAVNGAFWLQRLIDLQGAEYAYSFAGRLFLQEPQTAVSGARMLSEAARAGSGEAHQLLLDLTQPGSVAYRRLLGEDPIPAAPRPGETVAADPAAPPPEAAPDPGAASLAGDGGPAREDQAPAAAAAPPP